MPRSPQIEPKRIIYLNGNYRLQSTAAFDAHVRLIRTIFAQHVVRGNRFKFQSSVMSNNTRLLCPLLQDPVRQRKFIIYRILRISRKYFFKSKVAFDFLPEYVITVINVSSWCYFNACRNYVIIAALFVESQCIQGVRTFVLYLQRISY